MKLIIIWADESQEIECEKFIIQDSQKNIFQESVGDISTIIIMHHVDTVTILDKTVFLTLFKYENSSSETIYRFEKNFGEWLMPVIKTGYKVLLKVGAHTVPIKELVEVRTKTSVKRIFKDI